ncbi:MAG: ROK family protein [Clostridia bacterium]|nr:ROK family protein [Clostridia bacterium]
MKSNTQLRQKSIKKVLNEIRIRGPLAKRELQEITGFSWGNISSITTELFNDNYITASGKIETYVGRRPEAFDINENDNLIIGIDFSTKGVLAVLCDLRGRVILKTEKLFVKREKAEAFDTLYASVDEILEGAQKRKILYIAIAMQGDVDSENGVSIKIRKIADWRNIPVCSILEEKYGIKSVMFHDPDCILHTEKYYGVLSDSTVSNALLLSITNHGIGIAALLSGKIYMGNGGKTCEIGNMVIPNSESNKSEFLQDMFTYDWINKHSGGAGD